MDGSNSCFEFDWEHGYVTISIVGKDKKMIPVASFDRTFPIDSSIGERMRPTNAVKNHFSSPPWEYDYCLRAAAGQTDPHRTWEGICNYYKLSRKFEIAPPGGMSDVLPEDRGGQTIRKDSGFEHPYRREKV